MNPRSCKSWMYALRLTSPAGTVLLPVTFGQASATSGALVITWGGVVVVCVAW